MLPGAVVDCTVSRSGALGRAAARVCRFAEATGGLRFPRPEDEVSGEFDRSRHSLRFRVLLPSTTEALNGAVRDVLRLAGRCGCAQDARADVEIALREALANAIIHGNGRENRKRIFLRCYGAPGSGLLILVRDEGAGFDPEHVPDPRAAHRKHLSHGRGLLLMRELMDHVEYRRSGSEVLIYKACRAATEE